MKALITGSRGFVGQHLKTQLETHGYTVCGVDLNKGENTKPVDILDKQAVSECINDEKPDVIFHLAAQSNVPLSWKNPQHTFEVNVIGSINLLEAVCEKNPQCRVILIGSSDEYGATGILAPISEDYALNPKNPYAESKRTQEKIAALYASAYSLDICMTRSFNHSGPGQGLGFIIPDLCSGIVAVESGKADSVKVGNLDTVRDYTDVRDIVKAYRLIYEKGKPGEVYNVGSGTGRKGKEILDLLKNMAKCEIRTSEDEEKMRASDTPILVCNNNKLQSHTGWSPEIPIEKTLKDTLDYWRKEKANDK